MRSLNYGMRLQKNLGYFKKSRCGRTGLAFVQSAKVEFRFDLEGKIPVV